MSDPVEEPKKDEEAKEEGAPAEGAEGAEAAGEGEGAEEVQDAGKGFNMAEDEFYPDDHVEKAFQDSDLSRRSMKFYQCYGLTSFKRYNFHWLGDNNFIFTTGNTYQIWDIVTNEKRIFHGTDVDGVGAIAVHPSFKYFAVAEKGTFPNIYIYEYPSLKLYRILRKGTEKMFAHVEFSIYSKGDLLASLGGDPDFTLTIWSWKTEQVVLKNKAFGTEVYRVSFSPYTDNVLFSMGSIHIRFWKMAQTFTGLKLQYETAKFGQLELTNVSCVAELPDGKCVSGTEYGTLIVWEGQFIKSHLMLDDVKKVPLHEGMVEILIQDNEYFISAGADGYIKWWRMAEIDVAEAEEGLDFPIAPVKEVLICDGPDGKNPAYIQNMILADNKWYIQDRKGKMYVMEKDETTYKCITEFHEGSVNGLVCSPTHSYAVSLGENGMIKVWDYVKKVVAYQKQFVGKGTCLEHMPATDGNKGRICAAGFDNGIIRILSVTADGLQILKSFKAHDDEIVGCKYSQDIKMLCTASTKGDIFFFECDGLSDLQKYEPLCTVKLPDNAGITDFKWNPDDDSVIFGCTTGYVYQVRRPKASEINNKDTYLWENADIKTWRIKMMEFQMQKNQKKDEAEEEKKRRMRLRGELPPEDEEPEEDWDPEQIYAILPFKNQEGQFKFIVASTKLFNGFIYICDFDSARPYKAIEIPAGLHVSYLAQSFKKAADIIIIGYDNGDIQLVFDHNFDQRMSVKYHDAHDGKITQVAFNHDDTFFMTAASDGLIFAHQFDRRAAAEENKYDPLQGVEGANFLPEDEKKQLKENKIKNFQTENPAVFGEVNEDVAMDEAALAITIKTKEPLNEDVKDPNQYSIQQDKLKSEEDRRRALAEKKKDGVREQISELRKEFEKIRVKNNDAAAHLRIGEDDFQIDPDFFMILQERNDAKIDETKKEVAYPIEYKEVGLNKLRDKYYEVLEFEKFTVKGIKNGSYVNTFRVQKMSEHLTSNIEAFKQMLENEIIGKDAEDDDDLLDEQSKDGENQVDDQKQKEKDKAAALAAKQKAALQAELNAKKTEHERKREQRKLEREERKRKIEKLDKKVAMNSGVQDAEDKKDIELALATFGDYKLKTSIDYTVPENQRINYQKKRQQMVLLEGSIHKLKVDFNQKIQELKLRKKDIIDHVQKLNDRLTQINSELNSQEELFIPQIDWHTEYPEKNFDIKDEEIENYRIKLQKEKDAAAAAKKGKGGKKQEEVQEDDDAGDDEEQKEVVAEKIDYKTMKVVPRKNAKVQKTVFDDEFDQIRKIELTYERDKKKEEINEIITAFDDEIREMQKEKYRLESDLKNAEMKLVLFFEELILLREMEHKDIQLTKRLADCRQEKGKILKEINDISRKLKDKKKEIDSIKEKEEDLMSKFHELCPERSEKYEEIRKFFEKIIKKKKKKPEKVEKPEGEEEEDEEGEEEEEEEEDEDEDEDENTITGLTNEDHKIEDIEKLREERLDLYDDKEKILQFINDLETSRKKLENKEKNIKSELEETEDEIQEFQSEKMSKMNELKIAVVLKIKQIQNMTPDVDKVEAYKQLRKQEIDNKMAEIEAKNEEQQFDDPTFMEKKREMLEMEEDWRGYFLPHNLEKSIMFTRTQLLQLIKRKRELDEEQVSLNKHYKEYQRQNRQNKKEIKENEKKREEKLREYNERQMLRFGTLVDLDNLEVSGPSSAVIEAEKKYERTEKKCQQRIEEAMAEFERTQRELTAQTKENTNLLNLIRKLGEEELDLDKKLNDSNKAIFVDEDEEKKKHILEEKMKIKKLLEIQAKEIETFKTEINMYKRKGGHIYTKVTTNRRVANLNQDN